MTFEDPSYEERLKYKMKALRWKNVHLDPILLFLLLIYSTVGLLLLFSAANQSQSVLLQQATKLTAGFILMFFFAQIPPTFYRKAGPWIYTGTLLALILVLFLGHSAQGAKRWLPIGPIHFQPSELMKLALPLSLAAYLDEKILPPPLKTLGSAFLLILVPTLLIVKQPDLGTGIVVGISGLSVLLFAGLSWHLILGGSTLVAASTPVLWHFMHDYQKNRVLDFLNPERDPLGTGYHIIQSKIAIGSGGFWGKGWLAGTQAHLAFLPAHTTDFIFAVAGEEFGFLGCALILILILGIFCRCLIISIQASDTFSRLACGSLSFIFIFSACINIGMVTGLLPVVGVPLTLISFGGSSMITSLISFGIIMSVHTHQKLWAS